MTSSILTASGKWFDVLKPEPYQIDLEDIASALSKLCRFGGHCKEFYSVAEHSLQVSRLIAHRGGNRNAVLWGLLHDASEAYLVDIPRPIKHLLPQYRVIEDGIQKSVADRFGLSWPIPDKVHQADNDMLALELRTYLPKQPDHLLPPVAGDSSDIWGATQPCSPDQARRHFLETAKTLGIN